MGGNRSAVRTFRISAAALSGSNSRVKQWQWTIGITSYTPRIRSRSCVDRMPRKASKNVIAESGKFITKCEIRLRGVLSIGSVICGVFTKFRRCACSLVRLFLGPEYAGKGSSSDRRTTERIKSRPSSHDTRTKSFT